MFGWEEALTTGEGPDSPECLEGWSLHWLLPSPDILPVLTSDQPLGPRSLPTSVSHIQDLREGDPQTLELPGYHPDAPRPSSGEWGFHVVAVLGCGDPQSPPRVPPIATGLGALRLLSRTGVHQHWTEAFLSETNWVKWMDLGLKMQARIFQQRAGAGWPGVVRPPLFRGKGLVVPDVCPTLVTHVTSHLDT